MNTVVPEVDATEQMAQQLAAPMILKANKGKRRFLSQNRDAWKRMYRPHKAAILEAGVVKVFAILSRFKVR